MNIYGTLMNGMLCSKPFDIPLSEQKFSLSTDVFVYMYIYLFKKKLEAVIYQNPDLYKMFWNMYFKFTTERYVTCVR